MTASDPTPADVAAAQNLAESQAQRGLFVRDGFGRPNRYATDEWARALAQARAAERARCVNVFATYYAPDDPYAMRCLAALGREEG
jgi:hypothetical protein